MRSFFARISSIDANSSASVPVVVVVEVVGLLAMSSRPILGLVSAYSSSMTSLSGYVDDVSNGGKSISRYIRTTVAEVCN